MHFQILNTGLVTDVTNRDLTDCFVKIVLFCLCFEMFVSLEKAIYFTTLSSYLVDKIELKSMK